MANRQAAQNQPSSSERPEPRARRTHMPPNYSMPGAETILLPWSHARERLENARIYWIATVRPTGQPHATPVWGVWVDDRLYFDGNPATRRGRNIAANPAVTVHLDSGGDGKDVVIVEGDAYPIDHPDHGLTTRIATAYTAKYVAEGYAPGADSWDEGGLYVMRPRVAFAWTELFKDTTCWQFDEA